MKPAQKNAVVGERWPVFALVAILVLAAVLRLANLASVPGWWPDEGVMLNIATNLSHGKMQMFSFTYPMNPHPPLFFLLAVPFIKIFGSSILTTRLISALLGTITVFVVYEIGKKIKDSLAGIVAALLVACLPSVILTSRIGLSYELLAALYALTLLLTISWDQKKHYKTLIAASVLASLCAITSYSGIVAIIFIIGFVAIRSWRRLPFAIVFCFLLPVLYVLSMLILSRDPFLHDLRYMFARPETQIGIRQVAGSFSRLWSNFPILILGLLGLIFTKKKVGIYVLGFLLLITLIEFKTRGYWWYMMTFLPLMPLGIACLVSESVSRKKIPLTIAIAFVAVYLIATSLWQSEKKIFIAKTFGLEEEKNFSPSDGAKLRSAVQYINAHTTDDDMVVSSAHISWMLKAKPSDPVLSYVSGDRSTINFPDDMASTGRFVYDPNFQKAKYYLEDKFMRGWFPDQPNIKQNVTEIVHSTWTLIMDLGEFKIYQNPEVSK